jgi:hypothetical protein
VAAHGDQRLITVSAANLLGAAEGFTGAIELAAVEQGNSRGNRQVALFDALLVGDQPLGAREPAAGLAGLTFEQQIVAKPEGEHRRLQRLVPAESLTITTRTQVTRLGLAPQELCSHRIAIEVVEFGEVLLAGAGEALIRLAPGVAFECVVRPDQQALGHRPILFRPIALHYSGFGGFEPMMISGCPRPGAGRRGRCGSEGE